MLRSILAAASAALSLGDDCKFIREQTQRNSPARIKSDFTDKLGVAVAWQDGDTIYFQDMDYSCTGGRLSFVNQSQEFWHEPGENGLGDVLSIELGLAHVVAWTLGGDVWFRIFKGPFHHPSQPIRANLHAEHRRRAEVRLVAHPTQWSGFLVAWSSWEQDGDGWGIFARSFDSDGKPMSSEMQLNSQWRHFQWRPQFAACASGALWAIWANSTGTPCDDDPECTSGPVLRFLGRAVENGWAWALGPEKSYPGDAHVASALACEADDSLTVLWLQHGAREVFWQYEQPPAAGPVPAPLTQNLSVALRGVPPMVVALPQEAPRLSASLNQWMPARWTRALPALPRARASSDLPQSILWSSGGGAVAAAGVEAGQVAMYANGGLLMLLALSDRGELTAQLLDFQSAARPVYRPMLLADAAVFAHASWSSAADDSPTVAVCWTEAARSRSSVPRFECARRSAEYFKANVWFDFGGKVTVVMALAVVVGCFCLYQSRRPEGRAFLIQRGGGGDTHTSRGSRTMSRARRRELQEQLAQIPSVAPAGDESPQRARSERSDCSGATTGTQCRAAPDPTAWNTCPLCHGEISGRVAIRRCGHTACRACITHLSDAGEACFACGGAIEDVQPVYM